MATHLALNLRVWTCGEAGDYSGGDTPVPIPNTVVKPSSPDDTAGAALWDNRTLPVSPPAQARIAPPDVYNTTRAFHTSPGRAGRLVTTAEGTHPFPSRTRSLSPPAPTILQGQPCGTIGRCRSPRPPKHGSRRLMCTILLALFIRRLDVQGGW